MSKSNTFETDLLGLIFNGTAITSLAINATASPYTNLYLSLHSADPGEAGDQTTNEIVYTSYARKAVSRDSGGFTVSGNQVTLTANQSFVACTGLTATATYFAVGTLVSGAGKILYSGAISPTISISTGVTPILGTGTIITED
jgi:hypothetical protein